MGGVEHYDMVLDVSFGVLQLRACVVAERALKEDLRFILDDLDWLTEVAKTVQKLKPFLTLQVDFAIR